MDRFFTVLNAELHNLYGPTEAAIDVTAWQCRSDNLDPIVPIGRPIANTQVYILDADGATGSARSGRVSCILAERDLARGYLNRPELTAERFVPDPFSDQPGARLYRTEIGCVGCRR